MASTPAQTGEDFLALVRRSGVLDPDQLDAFLRDTVSPSLAQTEAALLSQQMVRQGLLTAFQAEQLLRGKWRGFLISGKYRLLDLLGAGGMGKVYLCEHIRMRRLVALKTLPASQANNPAMVERFEREARAVAALKHDNIVQAYDIDQDGNLHFLVMEFVDGIGLNDFVRRNGPLAPVRAAHYIAQAAWGLQHAHETAGIVHRDIKPGNLLLDRGGTIKILDMGLARFFYDKTDELTREYDEKSVLGTADYLAPEQALNSSDVDIRADIYSLGATFYFLLTGRPPFEEGNITQKLLWHQMREPMPVRTLRPDVPEELAGVIARMMNKDVSRRYQLPIDVVEALAPWTNEPIELPSDEEIPRRQLGPLGAAPANRSVRASSLSIPAPRTGSLPALGRTGRFPTIETRAAARQRRRWPWLLGSGLLFASLLLLVLWANGFFASPELPPSGFVRRPGAMVLTVSKSGQPEHFLSIREALAQAQPEDRILVTESPWAETLTLTLSEIPGGNVTIEGRASDGKPVVWQVGAGHPGDQPLLDLTLLPGMRFENFHFDGKNRCKDLISASGQCSGLTLANVSFRHFRRSAFRANALVGVEARPIVLEAAHFQVPDGGQGLRFDAQWGARNRYFQVRNCRFEGPGQAAIACHGTVANLVFEQNRVSGFATVLSFHKIGENRPALHGQIAANTFYDIGTAFRLEAVPMQPFGPLTVQNNLFVRTRRLMELSGSVPPAKTDFLTPATWNAADAADLVGAETLGVGVVPITELNTDPRSEQFLRYPTSSPLSRAGPQNQPAGLPPEMN